MSTDSILSRIASGLTTRRIRAHGLILAVGLWSGYALDLSPPGLRDRNHLLKGTDFLHFYTLGSLALRGLGSELYDSRAQEILAQQLVPGSAGLYHVPLYGPQVSLFFAPFARFSYPWALALWWFLSAVLYALCCYAIWKVCPRLQSHGLTVLILAIAYPAFFHLIAWGQTSAPALVCFTLPYLALRSHHRFLAGLAVGLLAFKPQLGLAAAIVFLFAGEWRVIAGAIATAGAQVTVAWMYYGTSVMRNYASALLHIRDVAWFVEPRPYQLHSLRAFWSLFIPSPMLAFACYVVSALLVLILLVGYWRSTAPLSLRFSALLVATVLVAPHLTVYDLVILAPAFLLLAEWTLEHPEDPYSPALRLLLYLGYALPLLSVLTWWTHMQLSVMAFVALLYCLTRISRPLPANS